MYKLVSFGSFFVSIVFCSLAQAKDFDVTICAVQAQNYGRMLINPCEPWQSINECADGWIVWDGETPGGQAMYSTALTALASDKKVRIRVVEGDSCSHYDVTTMIRIIK